MTKRANSTGYLAAPGFLPQLLGELRNVKKVHDHLVIAAGDPQTCTWAENIWYDPQVIEVASIGEAAKALKAIQRNWWPYAWQLHRRHALIQEKLPHVGAKPMRFPEVYPDSPLGSFTLLGPTTLLASPVCSSPFPNGVPSFVEDGDGPPSRAYLKLWEAFTHLKKWPTKGERCLDLGASPGGWTWVLAKLGASVIAYDRAELAPNVLAMRGVSSVKGDAFAATPDKVGPVNWLCSDVICYPERLRDFVKLWLDSGRCKNFVCTLKFQGDSHYGVIDDMRKIPGSTVIHLHNNKHEVTWMLSSNTFTKQD